MTSETTSETECQTCAYCFNERGINYCHYYPETPISYPGCAECPVISYERKHLGTKFPRNDYHNWRNGLPINDEEARKSIIRRNSKGVFSQFDDLLPGDNEVFDDPQSNESYVDYRKRMESYEVSEPIKPKVVRKPSRFDGII